MIRDPQAYEVMLGSTFTGSLTDRKERPALRIGSDVWSRHDVATKLGIVNTKACSILTGVCKTLGIRNTKHLFESTSPYTFAGHRCGVTTLYAMFAAFRDKGLVVETWYRRPVGEHNATRVHKREGQPAIVSFLRLKHRELEAERRTKESAKRHAKNVHQFKRKAS